MRPPHDIYHRIFFGGGDGRVRPAFMSSETFMKLRARGSMAALLRPCLPEDAAACARRGAGPTALAAPYARRSAA